MFLYKKETLHYRNNIEWENILWKYLYGKELIIRTHEELQKINRKIEKNQLKRNNRSNWTFSKREHLSDQQMNEKLFSFTTYHRAANKSNN